MIFKHVLEYKGMLLRKALLEDWCQSVHTDHGRKEHHSHLIILWSGDSYILINAPVSSFIRMNVISFSIDLHSPFLFTG